MSGPTTEEESDVSTCISLCMYRPLWWCGVFQPSPDCRITLDILVTLDVKITTGTVTLLHYVHGIVPVCLLFVILPILENLPCQLGPRRD